MTNKRVNRKVKVSLVSLITLLVAVSAAIVIPTSSSAVGPTIRQGSTSTYGVLAGSTITNTGATTISGTAGGDVGLSPGTSYTGSTTVTRSGADHINDVAAATAKVDLIQAYDDLSTPTATTLTASNLGGQTILPGTYITADGTISNSGALVLNAQGDSTAVFIFRTASTLTTLAASSMTLTNGAQACNVYWQVGSSATLGVSSTFIGHIYALTSITANTGASIQGQLLARNAAVTLDANTIVNTACVTPAPVATPVGTPVATPVAVVPAATPVATPVAVVPMATAVATPVAVVPVFPGEVSTLLCTSTDVHKISLVGNFPLKVTRVSLNGINLANTKWIQSEHRVVVTQSPGSTQTFVVDLFAGETQLVATQIVVCPEAVAVVIPVETLAPTPTAIAVETPTVTGGELPNTGSNTYTYLLIGFVMMGLGAGSLLIRNRVQS
jgi:LPXTG-motif cell wall-anchored protein